MATYGSADGIAFSRSPGFEAEHPASGPTPLSGIYRCLGCGREEVSRSGEPLPPREHHRHTRSQGLIRWRLIVWADHRPK